MLALAGCGAGDYGERVAQQAEGIEVPPWGVPVDSGNTVRTEGLSEGRAGET